MGRIRAKNFAGGVKRSNGTCVVFENPRTESFTYQINGPHAKYLGVGNHHDERYEFICYTAQLITNSTLGSGVAHNDEHCPISIALYPSDVMNASYVTHRPIILAVAVLFTFAFTYVVFCLYHKMVERRNQKISQLAAQSSAIVSSLFPANVHHRLYLVDDKRPRRLNSLLSIRDASEDSTVDNATIQDHALLQLGRCQSRTNIAELYPETTVFFADIVGFTAWSSVHSSFPSTGKYVFRI
jgi:hypothetical protein